MPMHFVFENIGEIDPLLIRTFGVNVKETDNPIGFFGTGLKYAIAILVRLGMPVRIQSGLSEFEFSKRTETIRGKEFDFVAMNGEPMGFTTEVGKTWKPWMAYRELYCNCQDEGGRTFEAEEMPSPRAGWTRVIVSDERFSAIARDHGRYFLTTPAIIKAGSVHIHKGISDAAYFRNVNVGPLAGKLSLYTYNLVNGIELTEDRTLRDQSSARCLIARSIAQCDNPDIIRAAVLACQDYLEYDLDFEGFFRPSDTFMSIVEDLLHDTIVVVNRTARAAYQRYTTKKTEPTPHAMNPVEQIMLRRAIDFAKRIGFDVDAYPISVVQSIGPNGIGMAANGRIYLAQRAFSTGTKYVAATLIEEFLHLRHGLSDCSREMQNHLFDLVVSLGEQVVGEPV